METCSICCENINKSTRSKIVCPYCHFDCCLACMKRYLMDSAKPADCMACHRELSLEFISQHTPKTFSEKEYRNKRANDLLSQEKSLLPDTQHLVEQEVQKRKNQLLIDELLEEKNYLKFRMKQIDEEIRLLSYQPQVNQEKERKKFIMGCPRGDCRGFLSQSWKCGTCNMYTCSKCHVVKGEDRNCEHVCNKDDLATAELIKQETKPCPQCAVPIYKINGCDLMWCTSCHVTFSWNRGEVVKVAHNHNPHYYQWQREQNNGVAPRVPGDNPCGCGDLPWSSTVRFIMRERGHKWDSMEACHRLIGHIRGIVLPGFPAETNMQDNATLRVKYLMNELDEEEWLRLLKARQKSGEKNRAVNQVLDMFVVSLTDLFNTYVNGELDNLEESADALRVYANRELYKISRLYKNKTYHVDNKWSDGSWYTNY